MTWAGGTLHIHTPFEKDKAACEHQHQAAPPSPYREDNFPSKPSLFMLIQTA